MPVSDSFPIKGSKCWFCKSSLMIQILVGSSFFFLLKVHRSLINVGQTFACLTVQNNWKQERLFTVCAQNEHIYEAKAGDRWLGEGDSCGKIRNMTEGRHLGVPTAGREACSELSSSGRVKAVLWETHESLLKQPVRVNKLSVGQSVSSEMDRVEWHFPQADAASSFLLTGGSQLSAVTASRVLHLFLHPR